MSRNRTLAMSHQDLNLGSRTNMLDGLLMTKEGAIKRSNMSSIEPKKEKEQLYTRVYVLGASGHLGFTCTDSVVKFPKLCSYNI